MTVKELVEYLQSFHADNDEVAVLTAWQEKRKYYDTFLGAFVDTDHPVLVVQIRAEHDFDEDLTDAAEEAEQESDG